MKIGSGRDYADVPPLGGTYRGTSERRLTVEVVVGLIDPDANPEPDPSDGVKPAS